MGFSETLNRTWNENILFSVLLELTYRCNLHCVYCYNDTGLQGKPLSTARYLALFRDLARLGTLNLGLTGGEPLAHPDFYRLGAEAKSLGFAVRIKSNGHALGERTARRLRREVDPFNIDISLHGACAETHDRQTRIRGSFDRLMRNLETLRGLDMRVVLNCTLTRWNELEIEPMQAIADRLGVRLNFNTEVTPRDNGDTAPMAISPSPEGLRRLYRFQAERQAAGSSACDTCAVADFRSPSGKSCGAGSSSLTVDPYGTVYPCVQWRHPLGNLHRHDISEIWAGGRELTRVREWATAAGAMLDREGPAAWQSGFCAGHAATAHGSPVTFYPGARLRKELTEEAVRRPIDQNEGGRSNP